MSNMITVNTPTKINIVKTSTNNLVNIQTEHTISDNLVNIQTEYNTIVKKGYSPFINPETSTWFEYDDNLKCFVDTGVFAGEGIPLTIEEINNLWDTVEEE